MRVGFAALMLMASCVGASPKVFAPRDLPLDQPIVRLDGGVTTLRAFQGQVVWVDFWAAWCTPCEASLPFYAELYERFRSEGLQVWAVGIDDDVADVKAFLRRIPVPFPVLHDRGAAWANQLGVQRMPTSVLVGRDGRTVWVHEGFVTADEPEIRSRIQAALAAPALPTGVAR